eukprot:15452914-Alexandrium_andersonii.AAC.1
MCVYACLRLSLKGFATPSPVSRPTESAFVKTACGGAHLGPAADRATKSATDAATKPAFGGATKSATDAAIKHAV